MTAAKKSNQLRMVDGLLLLDKPSGVTSNQLLQQVKRLFRARKAGHTGALDPIATGLLPICFGEATKFAQFLLDADKSYRVMAQLGVRTDTADTEGQVVSRRPVAVDMELMLEALAKIRTTTEQIPPIYSALKYRGKPLYSYARRGIDVPRQARPITLHKLELVDFSDDRVVLDLRCSKGGYVRTIVDDLGELLGCGAHVVSLRRTSLGIYDSSSMLQLEELLELDSRQEEITIVESSMQLDSKLLPVSALVNELSEINLALDAALQVMAGKSIPLNEKVPDGFVRLTLGQESQFMGVGLVDGTQLVAKRLLARGCAARP